MNDKIKATVAQHFYDLEFEALQKVDENKSYEVIIRYNAKTHEVEEHEIKEMHDV